MPTQCKYFRLVSIAFLPFILNGCVHQPSAINKNLNQVEPLNLNTSLVSPNTQLEGPTPQTFPFNSPQVAALYTGSVPQSQDILPQAPIQIVIDSSRPLTAQSAISITSLTHEGVQYGVGPVSLNEHKTSLSRHMTQAAPDGLYLVSYSLCEESGTCSSGQFNFALDSFWLTQYQNWTHLSQVEISLEGQAFLPRYVRVSSGTTVTWKNTDTVLHTVDSDPLVTHSYNPSLSSFELQPGETYAFTFGVPGWYPYRCSLHAQTMTGVVLVE